MSDPAIEAVRRAREASGEAYLDQMTDGQLEVAREALKPIRGRHKPVSHPKILQGRPYCSYCWNCYDDCPVLWPCDDAKDAFSEEEIAKWVPK